MIWICHNLQFGAIINLTFILTAPLIICRSIQVTQYEINQKQAAFMQIAGFQGCWSHQCIEVMRIISCNGVTLQLSFKNIEMSTEIEMIKNVPEVFNNRVMFFYICSWLIIQSPHEKWHWFGHSFQFCLSNYKLHLSVTGISHEHSKFNLKDRLYN